MKKPEQTHSGAITKAVSIAVIIMAVSNIASRLLGFVRIKVLATYGGIGDTMDAYVFAFLLPDIINHLLAGGALSITFIPLFQKLLAEKDEQEAWKFFSNVLTVGTLLFIGVIGITIAFTDTFLSFAGKNITGDPAKFALTVKLTRIILPAQIFFFWGALFNGVQFAKKHFMLPALTPVLYNLGIIGIGILLYKKLGIEGFSWGVVVGAFAGNVLIQVFGALSVGMKYRPCFKIKDPMLIKYALITLPFLVGFSLQFSNEFLLKIFGSYVPHGHGAIASLDYSYKIMFLAVGIFGQSFAAGFYPFLSQLAIEKNFEKMNALLHSVITKIGVFLISSSGLLLVSAREVIVVLLQGGKFDETSVNATATVFLLYIPGAFFCGTTLVISRCFYSLQQTMFPMIVISSTVVAFLPLYWVLSLKYGAAGIALSATLMMIAMVTVLYISWNRKSHNTYVIQTLKNLLIIITITVVASIIMLLLKDFFYTRVFTSGSTFLRSLLTLSCAYAASLIVLAIAYEKMGLLPVRSMLQSGLRRLQKLT